MKTRAKRRVPGVAEVVVGRASRRDFIVQVSSAIALTSVVGAPGRAQSAGAFDYYISPTGRDSNPGTQTSPWAITAIETKGSMIAGKRVGLLDGTYVVPDLHPGSARNDNAFGQIFVNREASGSAAAPTVIESVNPRGAVLTQNNGGTYFDRTACMFIIKPGTSHITFRNIRFYQLAFGVFHVYGDSVRIEGCDVEDIDGGRIGYDDNMGFVLSGLNGSSTCKNLVVSNCVVRNIRGAGGNHNASAGIGPVFHVEGLVVEYCSFFNLKVGVYVKNYGSGYTVRNCYFDSTVTNYGLLGIMTDAASFLPSNIHNNVFNRQREIANGDMATHQAITNFYNNTFILSSGGSAVFIYLGPGGARPGSTFVNNLFYYPNGFSGYDFVIQSNSAAGNVLFSQIDYNIYRPTGFQASDRTPGGGTFTSLSQWSARTGGDFHSRTGIPSFVAPSGASASSYRLAPGSLGVGMGSDGTDVGAWGRGATMIGHNFAQTSVKTPASPDLIVN
jgi:hypothetical protein